MDIVEKVDIPKDNEIVKLNTDVHQNNFVLPSQSIINFDLTPLKFTDISNENDSVEPGRVPPFVENLIDFNKDDDMMMSNHATLTSSNEKASNSIWVPADKHPQISPSEYNHWIKIHTNEKNNSSVTVSRKRSVLSTLSFNATDDDSNSNESNTSDEDEDLTTPTAITLPPLPDSFTDNLKEEHLIKEVEEEANEEENTNGSLCRQANYATTYDTEQEKSLNLLSIKTNDLQQQPPNVTQNVKEKTIQHSPQVVTKSPDSLIADHHSKKDRKSWFTGLLHDLKKTNKPHKSKKTGLTGLFSRSSKKLEPANHPASNTKNSNTVKTQQHPSLSPTKPRIAKPKKKKSESAISKNDHNLSTQRDNEPLPQRYSLYTERAIYRMSHVKLGNSRRPLQHQVVISNMMYWYLSIQQQQEQQEQPQQQQQQQNYYHNNIYQATYQSFEPPTPGGGDRQHQPPHSYPNTHHQQQKSYRINPFVQQISLKRFNDNYTPIITEKPKNSNTNQSKKKQYKPVQNNNYDPLVFENIIGIHNFQ